MSIFKNVPELTYAIKGNIKGSSDDVLSLAAGEIEGNAIEKA